MQILENKKQEAETTTTEALLLFDQLDAPDMEWVTGFWKGSTFPTNHFMDGLLNASGWYGKAFKDADHVHPLLFYKANQRNFCYQSRFSASEIYSVAVAKKPTYAKINFGGQSPPSNHQI